MLCMSYFLPLLPFSGVHLCKQPVIIFACCSLAYSSSQVHWHVVSKKFTMAPKEKFEQSTRKILLFFWHFNNSSIHCLLYTAQQVSDNRRLPVVSIYFRCWVILCKRGVSGPSSHNWIFYFFCGGSPPTSLLFLLTFTASGVSSLDHSGLALISLLHCSSSSGSTSQSYWSQGAAYPMLSWQGIGM